MKKKESQTLHVRFYVRSIYMAKILRILLRNPYVGPTAESLRSTFVLLDLEEQSLILVDQYQGLT